MDFNNLQKFLYFIIILLMAGVVGLSALLISALIQNLYRKNNN